VNGEVYLDKADLVIDGMTAPEKAPPKVRGRYINQIQGKMRPDGLGRAKATLLQLRHETFVLGSTWGRGV
jgi:hypothetical protein